MKSLPTTNILFDQFIQELPSNYHEMAYEFKAFVRPRKIRSPLQLLEVVMLYCGMDFSLRSCAGQIAQMQGYISDTSVNDRLKACVPWVKAMLASVFGFERVINKGSLRFIVIDGSTVQEPGAKETTYRLHIAIDLVSLTFHQVELTTDKEGEHLDHYCLGEGDVVLLDRGYNQPKTLVPFIDRGGEVILRYNAHSMNLFNRNDDEMKKIDWQEELHHLNEKPAAIPVYLCHDGKRIEGYLHAIPLPEAKAQEARRKAHQRAKKKGRTASKKALYISGWVLIFTSLPLEILETEAASDIYRVRWQVELVIKRMKSLLNVDKLRAFKGGKLADLYLYGKLLYAAVVEKIVNRRFSNVRTGMIKSRTITPWRLWNITAEALRAAMISCFPYRERYQADAEKSMTERPRRRKLQTLPEPIFDLIDTCRGYGLSHV
jgi:hypothetical protein